MKLKISKTALLDGLQKVQNVVGIRTPLPILSNVLLNAKEGQLQLTTTNLDVSIRCQVAAEVSKPGATTLPVKRILGIARELAENDVELEVEDDNTAKIRSGASFFKVIGLSEDEFPPIPVPKDEYSYRLEQGVFKEMLRKTAYAASTDETRHVLNGVLLSFKGNKLTVVATDGRRLALVEHEMDIPKETEGEMVVPSKTIGELIHILGDEGELKIYRKDNQIMLEFGETLVCSKLLEGTYPNYRQVIPAQCNERVTIERETFLTALRRISVLITDKSNASKLAFTKNKLEISITTPEVGEALEKIAVKYSGREISIAFNPEFIMDPLKNITNDEIFFEMSDDLSPGVIKCDLPFLYVLMPMRIG